MLLLLRWMGWIIFFSCCYVIGSEPDNIYLTWVDDPTTTMTIVWQGGDGKRVIFHSVDESKWLSVAAQSHRIAKSTIYVYIAQIQGLKSDTAYVFKVEGSEREYRFRTLPEQLTRKVRFVVGGDILYYWGTQIFEKMNRVISTDNPDFVVLGGDLAYTTGAKQAFKGRKWEIKRWQEFLKRLQQTLQTQEGRLIPILPLVGNHDVHQMAGQSNDPELFYEIFPFPVPGQAYRRIQAGDYLSLVLLDSGHTWPIDGRQAEWLRDQLKECNTPYLFAAYHIGAYPSVYKYKGDISTLLRQTWVPLFEEAHLSAAFEHHSHALKRTYPIRKNQKDSTGVIYLGDGSWGVPPRKTYTMEEQWYLEKVASINACWFIHLSDKSAEVEARTPEGEVVDQMTLTPRSLLQAKS